MVKEYLTRRCMSITELSIETGISRTTITDLVKGRKDSVTLKTALRLAKALNCTAAELFPELISQGVNIE